MFFCVHQSFAVTFLAFRNWLVLFSARSEVTFQLLRVGYTVDIVQKCMLANPHLVATVALVLLVIFIITNTF